MWKLTARILVVITEFAAIFKQLLLLLLNVHFVEHNSVKAFKIKINLKPWCPKWL